MSQDGTGIKFNKDADRMNAESKKKADVLSDEVLQYIQTEQGRRTTLNRRVMAAVQHGERGVTIVELRHRPSLIIRRGALYRCPSNRAVREPDMNGLVLCGLDKIPPTQIVYDSCLAAEDSPLYITENSNLFYCNRHRDTSPELPHNGTVAIACHPRQRTAYKQTLEDCSKDTDGDVIVHYRYYPDRTYKYVHELDPDQEICDRFNPCKLGYIFKLATPEMAIRATDLFKDSDEEFAPSSGVNLEISTHRVDLPPGAKILRVFMKDVGDEVFQVAAETYEYKETCGCLTFKFAKIEANSFGVYFAVYADAAGKENEIRIMKLTQSKTVVKAVTVTKLPGMNIGNESTATFTCDGCSLERLVQRNEDGAVNNVARANYRTSVNKQTKEHSLNLHYEKLILEDFGEYFIVVRNPDTTEEKLKVITLLIIKLEMAHIKGKIGEKIDKTVSYECRACTLTSLLCNGHEVSGATIDHDEHAVLFYFPRFHDTQACVYAGIFKVRGSMYVKMLAVVDNLAVTTKLDPVDIEQDATLDHTVSFDCIHCKIQEVYVNGRLVPQNYYAVAGHNINFHIVNMHPDDSGVYQGIFNVNDKNVTTTLMEIKVAGNAPGNAPAGAGGASAADGDPAATGGASIAPDDAAADATTVEDTTAADT